MRRKIAKAAEERFEKTLRDAQKMKRELHEMGENRADARAAAQG